MLKSSLTEIRRELSTLSQKELVELNIRLIKYKKENKELADYYLFEKQDEKAFIHQIKQEIDAEFLIIKYHSLYHFKKSIRKILRKVEKYGKYSGNPITQIETWLYFCEQAYITFPSWNSNETLKKITERLIKKIEKSISTLHEDLQFDYGIQLTTLIERIH